MALYRDANASGDRVMSENYLQHADHYYRIICAANAEAEARRNPPQPNGNAGDPAPVTEARPQQGDGTGQRAVTEPEPNGRDVSNSPEGTVDPGSAPQPEIVVLEGDGAAQEAAPAAERESRGSGQRRNGHGGRGGQRRGRSAQQKTEQPQTKPAPAGESAEPASPAPAAAPADAEPSA